MTQPYIAGPQTISIGSIIGRRIFIKLHGAPNDENVLRVPADGDFLLIRTPLARQIKVSYVHDRYASGHVEAVYQSRDPIEVRFSIITLDERDRERLLSWCFGNYDVSVMEVYDDDVSNPQPLSVGPITVDKWKITNMTATNPTGNIVTGPYQITLIENDFDDANQGEEGFYLFKYAIEVIKDAESFFVPSIWDTEYKGLNINKDVSRTIERRTAETDIAFSNQIIEDKGRSNLAIDINFTTSSLEEISVLEWAKDNIKAVKFWEWSEYPEMSALTPDIGRPFAIALNDVSSVYHTPPFGATTPIQPTWWRIIDLSYSQKNLSEYSVQLTLAELI